MPTKSAPLFNTIKRSKTNKYNNVPMISAPPRKHMQPEAKGKNNGKFGTTTSR